MGGGTGRRRGKPTKREGEFYFKILVTIKLCCLVAKLRFEKGRRAEWKGRVTYR